VTKNVVGKRLAVHARESEWEARSKATLYFFSVSMMGWTRPETMHPKLFEMYDMDFSEHTLGEPCL